MNLGLPEACLREDEKQTDIQLMSKRPPPSPRPHQEGGRQPQGGKGPLESMAAGRGRHFSDLTAGFDTVGRLLLAASEEEGEVLP